MRAPRAALPFRSVNVPGRQGYCAGLQRHHVLPRQLLDARGINDLIDEIGTDSLGFHDFRRNGLLLPATDEEAVRLGLPLHRGPHQSYNELVIERMGQIEAGWQRRRRGRQGDGALTEALCVSTCCSARCAGACSIRPTGAARRSTRAIRRSISGTSTAWPRRCGQKPKRLDPYPTRFAHRDGADFGPARGSRSEQCGAIVTDERHCDGPKSARPEGVALESPVAASQHLHGANQPALRAAFRHGAFQSNHGVQTWSDRRGERLTEKRRAVGGQRGGRSAVFGFEPVDPFGHAFDRLDRADTLARAPDILPRLGVGVAARTEIHL